MKNELGNIKVIPFQEKGKVHKLVVISRNNSVDKYLDRDTHKYLGKVKVRYLSQKNLKSILSRIRKQKGIKSPVTPLQLNANRDKTFISRRNRILRIATHQDNLIDKDINDIMLDESNDITRTTILSKDEIFQKNPKIKSNIHKYSEMNHHNPKNEAQLIQAYSYYNVYGKLVCGVTGNLITTKNIANRKHLNFGSLGNYDIDTIPQTYGKVKGTEITWLSSDNHQFAGKQMLSRKTVSNILLYWSYISGIPYYRDKGNVATGIELWSTRVNNQYLITGENIKPIIKDLIFLYRNDLDRWSKKVDNAEISQQLANVVMARRYTTNRRILDILQEMKKKMSLVYNIEGIAWNTPKYSVEYLRYLLKELDSGNYILDIVVPLIIHPRKYPIRCTSLSSNKPKTDREHKKCRDDYDITRYIWERSE